jgi:TPR repeat protein
MAFAWFQKAALQGHTSAQIMTGSMLAAGRGTSKNLAAAYLWTFAATLKGDDRGAAELRVLERQLTSDEIEEAKVRAQSLLGAHVAASQVALSH